MFIIFTIFSNTLTTQESPTASHPSRTRGRSAYLLDDVVVQQEFHQHHHRLVLLNVQPLGLTSDVLVYYYFGSRFQQTLIFLGLQGGGGERLHGLQLTIILYQQLQLQQQPPPLSPLLAGGESRPGRLTYLAVLEEHLQTLALGLFNVVGDGEVLNTGSKIFLSQLHGFLTYIKTPVILNKQTNKIISKHCAIPLKQPSKYVSKE